jgi:tetratricopeptide (TPR) repeat protein
MTYSGVTFSLTFAHGRGLLSLRDRDCAGVGHVDLLELEIPNLRFPCDLSGGVSRFRNRRLCLRELSLKLGAQDLAGLLSPAALGAFGIFEPRISIDGPRLGLVARIAIGDREVELTAWAVISALPPRGACLCVHGVHAYGFLPVPAPLVVVALFSALGARRDCAAEQPLAPLLSIVSASEIRVDVCELAMLALMSMNGWRLPDRSRARIRAAAGSPGTDRLHLVLSHEDDGSPGRVAESGALSPADEARLHQGDDVVPEARAMRDFSSRAATVEEALALGDVPGALACLRALGPVEAEDKVGTWRLLQILTAGADTLREAGQVAQAALARWPTFAPAVLALAVVASERGDAAEAGSCFERLAELCEAQGRREGQSCALLAAALHYARARQTGRALADLQCALGHRAGMDQAARARVMELARGERWGEILSVVGAHGARADGHGEARGDGSLAEKLRHLLGAAEIAEHLGKPADAASCLDMAVGLAPGDVRVLGALERLARAMGDPRAVVEILRRRLRESRPAQGKAMLRVLIRLMADCDELADDVRDACAVLLELAPGDEEALLFQARVARPVTPAAGQD